MSVTDRIKDAQRSGMQGAISLARARAKSLELESYDDDFSATTRAIKTIQAETIRILVSDMERFMSETL